MIELSRQEIYTHELHKGPFYLAGDIGGTNSNFGIFVLVQEKPVLIRSLHFKSKMITSFAALLTDLFNYVKAEGYEFEAACIGAAGIISPHRRFVKLTNVHFDINMEELLRILPLKRLVLINDFEAVALGVDLIDPQALISVQPGKPVDQAHKGFLGAGTGLGMSMLTWHKESNIYIPVASEGGHADASFEYDTELALMHYMSNNCPTSWEHVLSGSGIQKIYAYLGTLKKYAVTEATTEIEKNDFNPDKISLYASIDQRCHDTFNLYARFYARCARNFALQTLPLAGLYIAGGIASKNIPLFLDDNFKKEFSRCSIHADIIARIPLYIISDYNISLFGALQAIRLHERGLL